MSSKARLPAATRSYCSACSSIASQPTAPTRKRKSPQPIRLSTHFSPTQKASQSSTTHDSLPSLQLLLRGGYIRSSSSGIFTLLPNALRIVRKLSNIIDHELSAISASRLALPNLLPSKLWHQSGRFHIMGSELYKLRDRKDSEFVLGPTHEEEITKLVSHEVDSDRRLPLRLYQITTKFRDEPRPRMGLLRTNEFLMKDLYSFDKCEADANLTYDEVKSAYARIFDRVFNSAGGEKRWKAAEADTGAIGGDKSHEYHVEDAAGEDTLISCSKCEYTANTEKAVSMPEPTHMPVSASDVRVLLYGCTDVQVQDQVMHAFVLPATRGLNETKIDKLISKLPNPASAEQPAATTKKAAKRESLELLYDSSSSTDNATCDWKDRPEGPLVRFSSLSVLADFECASLDPDELNDALVEAVNRFTSRPTSSPQHTDTMPLVDLFPTQFGQYASSASSIAPPLTLVDIRNAETNDTCPKCRQPQSLKETRAIEIGHTFYLGDRYSRALEAGFIASSEAKPAVQGVEKLSNGRVPFQMGCYGIGVSRILGALAQKAVADFENVHKVDREVKKKSSGFVWPSSVAPFTAVVMVANAKDKNSVRAAEDVWTQIVNTARSDDQSVRQVLAEVVRTHSQRETGMDTMEREGIEEANGWTSDEASEIVIDDRTTSLGSKLADSDLMGYSYRLIVGKALTQSDPKLELQHLTNAGWNTIFIPPTSFGSSA